MFSTKKYKKNPHLENWNRSNVFSKREILFCTFLFKNSRNNKNELWHYADPRTDTHPSLSRHTIKRLKQSYSAVSVTLCGNEPTTFFNFLITWDRTSDTWGLHRYVQVLKQVKNNEDTVDWICHFQMIFLFGLRSKIVQLPPL